MYGSSKTNPLIRLARIGSRGVFMLVSALFLLSLLWGCKTPPERNVLPAKRIKTSPRANAQAPIHGPALPSLDELSLALKEYEEMFGLQFFRNSKARYMIYSASGHDHFSIADVTGACLYDVKVSSPGKGGGTSEDSGAMPVPALEVSQMTCGLTFPYVDPLAMTQVISTAEKLIFPALEGRLNGGPWLHECSDINFVQQVLNVPFELGSGEKDLEQWLSASAEAVEDPFDLNVGDVVFAGPPDRALVGIYAGYGLVVLNSRCDSADVHRLRSDLHYRVYRLYNGFSWSRYKVRDDDYLGGYLDKSG